MARERLNKSSHIPNLSGNILTIAAADSGGVIVDTELRHVRGFGVQFAQDTGAAAAAVTAELVEPTAGGTYKLLLKTWKGNALTSAATGDAVVSWFAFGD